LARLIVKKVIMKGGNTTCKFSGKPIVNGQEHVAVFSGKKVVNRFFDYDCQEKFQELVNSKSTIKRFAHNPEKEKQKAAAA